MRASVLPTTLVLLLILLPATGFAATYVVQPDGSGDFTTIQDALNAASNGDVICLGDGAFTGAGNKDLDPGGVDIVIQPLPGASPVINCEGSGRAFHIHSGETAAMVVRGIAMINGLPPGGAAAKGGAILIENASPTILNNTISDNEAGVGGGLYLDNSSSLIVRNAITSNDVGFSGPGAGLYLNNSTATIYDNLINLNEWTDAMYAFGGTISIVANRFVGNGWVDTGWNDINIESGTAIIVGNRFEDSGGCVQLVSSSAAIRANHLMDSYRLVFGSGIYLYDSNATIDYNYFERMSDGVIDWGGGSTGSIARNVIAWTSFRPLDSAARAIQIDDGTYPTIENNTFYENYASYPSESANDIDSWGNTLDVSECIFVSSVAVENAMKCGAVRATAPSTSSSPDGFNYHWGGYGDPGGFPLILACGAVSVLTAPMLCDPDNENFFATSQPDTFMMGALPTGCTIQDVLTTSVPPDDSLSTTSAIECVVLSGFSVQNVSEHPAPVNYRLTVSGPASLDDNGDFMSLAGTSPVLDPGESWVPPEAKVTFDTPETPGVVTVSYSTAYAPAFGIPDVSEVTFTIFPEPTGVEPQRPSRYVLEQSVPNPANPSATIAFSIPAAGEVTLALYDVRGRLVKILTQRSYPAGRHVVAWDGTDAASQRAASGIYFYRIHAGNFLQTKKLVLLK